MFYKVFKLYLNRCTIFSLKERNFYKKDLVYEIICQIILDKIETPPWKNRNDINIQLQILHSGRYGRTYNMLSTLFEEINYVFLKHLEIFCKIVLLQLIYKICSIKVYYINLQKITFLPLSFSPIWECFYFVMLIAFW